MGPLKCPKLLGVKDDKIQKTTYLPTYLTYHVTEKQPTKR